MNNLLKVAIMLTAYDNMSREIQAAVNKSKKELTDLKNHATAQFAQGFGLIGAGATGFAAVGRSIKDFADLQESANDLKAVMRKDGGILNEAQFKATTDLAVKLGNKLPGTTADFSTMFTTMIEKGLKAENILGGVGESAANLAIVLKMPYAAAGEFAAKMKEATGVSDLEMTKFMDTIARTKQAGVDVTDMQYAFSKSTGALKLLGQQGLQTSKSVATVYAMLARSGQSGEVIGTGMTSMMKGFLDADKMAALNAEAGKFGINMQFMKDGKFLGMENMMAQFSKMKNLTAEQKNAISTAFLGSGQDANLMNILADKGAAGFNEMSKAMSEQATLEQKVADKTAGLNSGWEALMGTLTNISAAMAQSLEPILTKVMKALNYVASAIQNFVANNPKIAKMIMLIIAFGSAALVIAGVVKIVQGIIAVMKILNIVMAMNPFILFAALAIIAISALIVYWKDIVAVIDMVGSKIMNVFNKIIGWFKKNWGTMLKGVLLGPFAAINALFEMAGINVVKSIWTGIKSFAGKPIEALKSMVQGMRDLLPFSPAKTGPFKDLHKLKIVETIAGTIKGSPMVQAMRSVVNQTAGLASSRYNINPTSGGGVTLHYAPVVHIGAGSSKADFMSMLNDHKDEILRMLNGAAANKSRTKF